MTISHKCYRNTLDTILVLIFFQSFIFLGSVIEKNNFHQKLPNYEGITLLNTERLSCPIVDT